MNQIMVLREKRAELSDKANEIISLAEVQSRDMSDQEEKELARIKGRIVGIDSDLSMTLDQMEADRKGIAGSDPNTLQHLHQTQPGALRPLSSRQGFAPILPGESRAYASMFGRPEASEHFGSLEEYLSTLHSGMAHPGIQAATGMSSGVGIDGGFLVPEEFASQILDAALEQEIVRPRCRVEPMGSGSKKIAGWDVADHSANIGGFAGQWVEEGTAFSIQKGKVRMINPVPTHEQIA